MKKLLTAFPAGAIAAATAHGLRMTVNLVVIKFVALSVGPAGLGALGNLLSVLSVLMVFAGGGISNGIAKYVAQHRNRPREKFRVMEAATAIGLAVSSIVFVLSIAAARPLAGFLFRDSSMWPLTIALGLTHLLCFVGQATIAVANGNARPGIFAAISITAYLATIPVAYLLSTRFGFAGAALSLMCMAGSIGIPSVWLVVRSRLSSVLKPRFHAAQTRQLLRFSAMTLTSAIAFPIAEVLVRQAIISQLGLDAAGIWQAAIRLSGAILGFYTIFLATSYMPRLSAEADPEAARRLVLSNIIRIGVLFAGAAVVIYLARAAVIPLLLSRQFSDLEQYMGWQLLGDFFRVCAYVIGFLIIARARLPLHIGAEVIQYALYSGVALLIIHGGGGLRGVFQAYAVSYACYFAFGLIWLQTHGKKLA